NSDAEALKHNFLLRGFFKNRGYEDASELTQNEMGAATLERRPSRRKFKRLGAFDRSSANA
ncbi:MAG: hypothetical protein WB439_14600, partial [Acidobacteriaceae bacterium]